MKWYAEIYGILVRVVVIVGGAFVCQRRVWRLRNILPLIVAGDV